MCPLNANQSFSKKKLQPNALSMKTAVSSQSNQRYKHASVMWECNGSPTCLIYKHQFSFNILTSNLYDKKKIKTWNVFFFSSYTPYKLVWCNLYEKYYSLYNFVEFFYFTR